MCPGGRMLRSESRTVFFWNRRENSELVLEIWLRVNVLMHVQSPPTDIWKQFSVNRNTTVLAFETCSGYVSVLLGCEFLIYLSHTVRRFCISHLLLSVGSETILLRNTSMQLNVPIFRSLLVDIPSATQFCHELLPFFFIRRAKIERGWMASALKGRVSKTCERGDGIPSFHRQLLFGRHIWLLVQSSLHVFSREMGRIWSSVRSGNLPISDWVAQKKAGTRNLGCQMARSLD